MEGGGDAPMMNFFPWPIDPIDFVDARDRAFPPFFSGSAPARRNC